MRLFETHDDPLQLNEIGFVRTGDRHTRCNLPALSCPVQIVTSVRSGL
jgi:hypothetical protein